jgi:hypothetical protein
MTKVAFDPTQKPSLSSLELLFEARPLFLKNLTLYENHRFVTASKATL